MNAQTHPAREAAQYDVIIIGAGAAGLMCAGEAAKQGRKTCIIEHAKKPAEKIRISGGGRCNFTNLYTKPENFISENPHFCKSALARFTPQDFIKRLNARGIAWHEKHPEKNTGQLFCDHSATDIIDMLMDEVRAHKAELKLQTSVSNIEARPQGGFSLQTTQGALHTESLVIASGGLSIPKIGASPFGYKIARQFGLNIVDPKPALVPLTFDQDMLALCKSLSGVSLEARASNAKASFMDGLLFTHRGLSGPAILQISSYLEDGEPFTINLAPTYDMIETLKTAKQERPKKQLQNIISETLPARLAESLCKDAGAERKIAELPDKALAALGARINAWPVCPIGTEGYRTAEVTRGGVDTNDLSSKTMEAKNHPGLYFIGEVVDVTGHLGGFNFQWAWASGYVAGQYV
ncbi:MAG: NAD(P)/FAD-dependent oxidoreductase [Alphaproteobacteria bacterium]|nr:NAD(P)/FAD-dependent oxidoreductase [Alphaproteobacteria bacterium]